MIQVRKVQCAIPILIILLCFLPVIMAMYLYLHPLAILTKSTVNYGELIKPPFTLTNVKMTLVEGDDFDLKKFQGYWLMLYFSPLGCSEDCANNLYKMRQVKSALGKDQNRVKRLFVTYQDKQIEQRLVTLLANDYPGTEYATLDPGELAKIYSSLALPTNNVKDGILLLVDPIGNVILNYHKKPDARGFLEDLKRLMKYSKLG